MFTQNGAKRRKHPVSSSSTDGNILPMRDVNRGRFELPKSLHAVKKTQIKETFTLVYGSSFFMLTLMGAEGTAPVQHCVLDGKIENGVAKKSTQLQ